MTDRLGPDSPEPVSSIRHPGFTYEYVQPPDYHFCQDSILFPALVADLLRETVIDSSFQALDVCSGCGVIGFELARHLPGIENFDFLELQSEFYEAFHANLTVTGRDARRFRLLELNYSALLQPEYRAQYDLIVGNPPYFMPGEGRPSSNEIANRARFFRDSDLKTLIRACVSALKPGGSAFLLLKSGGTHGRTSLRDMQLWLAEAGHGRVSIVGRVRTTDVVRIDA